MSKRSRPTGFASSGIYPIHGLIVVKDEHIKRHPWLARSLMNAFVAAKKPYLEELKRGQGDSPEDKRYRNFLSLMSDPLPYGMRRTVPASRLWSPIACSRS